MQEYSGKVQLYGKRWSGRNGRIMLVEYGGYYLLTIIRTGEQPSTQHFPNKLQAESMYEFQRTGMLVHEPISEISRNRMRIARYRQCITAIEKEIESKSIEELDKPYAQGYYYPNLRATLERRISEYAKKIADIQAKM